MRLPTIPDPRDLANLIPRALGLLTAAEQVLDDVGALQLWIPIGFGHGFCVLSETADFVYKCTSYYDGATESGIAFHDPEVGIEWPDGVELLFSERDRVAPTLHEWRGRLPF